MSVRSNPNAAPALLAVLLTMVGLCLPGRSEPGAGNVTAETISGSSGIALKALAGLADGDGVILIAPGLQYYAVLGKHPAKLSVLHLTPGKEPLSEDQFEGWKQAVPVAVISPSFENGAILARAGNAALRVVDPTRMKVPAERCVVVLDPEFFLPLYENEVRGGMIDLSVKLYRTLLDKGAARFPLYVVDPLSAPPVPLQWAYLGELWKEIWRRPDAFRDDLPEKWRLRREAEVLAEFGQFEEAADRLDAARRYFPKDGSIDYQQARLAFWDREIPLGIRFLNRATKADPRFLRGFTEFGAYFAAKDRMPAAEMVYRGGLRLRAGDAGLNAALMMVLLRRAESEQVADPSGARKVLEEAVTLGVPDGMKEKARGMLEKLAAPPSK